MGQDVKEEKKNDSDSDFDLDDDDEVMRGLREQRMAQMKQERQELEENMAKGHGQYQEIVEDEFLPTVTKSPFTVVHWYHKDFERCKIIDHHLAQIAKQHVETKFCKIDAEKCPFFVAKL